MFGMAPFAALRVTGAESGQIGSVSGSGGMGIVSGRALGGHTS